MKGVGGGSLAACINLQVSHAGVCVGGGGEVVACINLQVRHAGVCMCVCVGGCSLY